MYIYVYIYTHIYCEVIPYPLIVSVIYKLVKKAVILISRCTRAFQKVKQEHETLRMQLETYFKVFLYETDIKNS